MKVQVPQLCLVTDPTVPDLLARIKQALEAGITMLQLRCHSQPASYVYELAQALGPLCRQYGTLFIVNDRIDVALATGADGVQLGGSSLPPAVARMLIGPQRLLFQNPQTDRRNSENRLQAPTPPGPYNSNRSIPTMSSGFALGISVHSLEQARTAIEQGADFLIAGTIFASRSHPDRPAAGTELLRQIKQHVPSLPVLGIGGINAINARQVMEAGADGIAVISAILLAEDIPHSVQELRRSIFQNPQADREGE
jgi:thiamine monophosphate synthase